MSRTWKIFIHKPRIYHDSVKEKFKNFGGEIEKLFNGCKEKVKDMENNKKMQRLLKEIQELEVKLCNDVYKFDIERLLKGELASRLKELEELVKKSKISENINEITKKLKNVTNTKIKLEKVNKLTNEISSEKVKIFVETKTAFEYVENREVDKAKKSIEEIRKRLEEMKKYEAEINKLPKIEVVLGEKILLLTLQKSLENDLNRIEKDFKKVKDNLDNYNSNKEKIKNVINYEDGILHISFNAGNACKICKGDIKEWKNKIRQVDFKGNKIDINKSIFSECKNLKTANLSSEITEISKNLFEGCSNLEEINNAKSVKTIGRDAFYECSSLKTIDLSNVTMIQGFAFAGCSNLQTIDIPNVTEIGTSAFYECSSLKTIDLSNVKTIDENAFYGCSSLQTIDLSNVKTIGGFAFSKCSSLQTIDLSNVKTIGGFAFSKCSSLQTIDLSNVKTIGEGAFSECSSLKEVTFEGDIPEFNKNDIEVFPKALMTVRHKKNITDGDKKRIISASENKNLTFVKI